MENFNRIYNTICNNQNIQLNTNILETGLINISLLLGILIYTGRDFLGSVLETRRNEILENVKDAEDRLNEANLRLNESQKQLNQVNLIITQIKNETRQTKQALLQSDANLSKIDLETRFTRALATLQTKERQIFLEIKQQIVLLVLKSTLIRSRQNFSVQDRSSSLINETINKLDGDLL